MTHDSRRVSMGGRLALFLALALLCLGLVVPAPYAAAAMLGTSREAVGSPAQLVTKAKKDGAKKNITVKKNVTVKKTVYVKKNVYVNKKVYVDRPVKRWSRKPHYGNVVAGVARGTMLGVAAVGIAPPPPGPNLCWYWTNPAKNRGYWDYCY
jgi:hypothetical protein